MKYLLVSLMTAVGIMNLQAQNVPSYVPTNGLVGYWPFNGNANDQSGNGNNGTVNGATLTADRNGNMNSAYSFNGVQDFIQTTSSISNIDTLTISTWVYLNSNDGGCYVHIGIDGNGGCNGVGIGSGGYTDWTFPGLELISLESCIGWSNSHYQVSSQNWFHLVFVKTHNTAKYYLNSTYLGLDTLFSATPPSNAIFFGNTSASPFTTTLNGTLDDISIWNRALTQQEINNMYNSSNNTCSLITSVTLNAQQTQSTITNTTVGYLPNSSHIIPDTTQWHYIALTKSGSNGNFYLDGNLVTSNSFSSVPYIWNSLLLGATQACVSCTPVVDFKGLIDEVRVSNIARSASNIASNYTSNAPFNTDVNTIGLFHFDNISGSSVPNSVGGAASTFGAPSLANGKFSQGMKFDGIDDYIRWSNSIPVNNMTVEFWVKSSDQSATMAMLEYAYNTGIYLQGSTITNPVTWSTGDTGSSITVNPTLLPYVWASNGTCKDTVYFNSQSATNLNTTYDTVTTLVTVTDTLVINAVITSLAPPNNLNTIKIYPNPTNDHITINYGNYSMMSGYQLKIENALGQVVFTTPINLASSYVNLSLWSGNGIYFVKIINPTGSVVENRKIVLQ